MAVKETQKHFFALSLNPNEFTTSPDDGKSLLKLRIKDAEKDDSIRMIASTYDFQNNTIRDGYADEGLKLITFSNILKHNTFPLADILQKVMSLGEKEMGYPVEIEFAVDLKPEKNGNIVFNMLQIRPIATKQESINLNKSKISKDDALIISESALGNGIINDIFDVVYIRPQNFEASRNKETVNMIDEINAWFLDEDKKGKR